MTPMRASSPSHLDTHFDWTVRENGLVVARGKNVQTTFGLTAYASGFQGSYQAPVYLVLETFAPALVSLVGTTLVLSATQQPTLVSDTQLVLSVGTVNQEVIGFTGQPTVNGSQYTYTLSSTPINSHAVNDICTRNPTASDTLTSVFSEQQYDSTNAPNQRMQSIGGYSPGAGQWTMQFFFSGTQALFEFVTLGLADNLTLGQGSLHNHLVIGYDHTSGNDAEIDVTLTLTNS
jgi:hypothetical protein